MNGTTEKRFHCYECGVCPPKPESEMQKYDCALCGGRKCLEFHTVDENLTCSHCGKDKLCNDCLAHGKCCR